MSESQLRSTIINLLVALEKKKLKESRDFMTEKCRYYQTEIRNQLTETQFKLEVLIMKFNEVEERVSDIEDKLPTRKEAKEKREKQLKIIRIA